MAEKTTLLLFDIDGTLLMSNGAGREAKRLAMTEVFGTAGNVKDHPFGGKTDWQILTEVLEQEGHPTHEIEAIMSEYEQVMRRYMEQVIADFDVYPCPNALELIEELRQRKDVLLGIVTGNISTTAPIKLKAAGFDPEWFPIGAYGSEALSRNDLPRFAIERARAYLGDSSLSGSDTIVIGDTVADVECARAVGAKVVAVRTGFEDSSELEASSPDYLLDDLHNFIQILSL